MTPPCGNERLATDAVGHKPRDAAAVFVGNTLRSLRRIIQFRMQGASPSKSLHEAKRARDSIDSAVWALEYECGLRDGCES
jgi:hypothetical protein